MLVAEAACIQTTLAIAYGAYFVADSLEPFFLTLDLLVPLFHLDGLRIEPSEIVVAFEDGRASLFSGSKRWGSSRKSMLSKSSE